MRTFWSLLCMMVAFTVGTALAVDPWSLPIGAHEDIRNCLGEDQQDDGIDTAGIDLSFFDAPTEDPAVACARAATAVQDAAWAELLRGGRGEGLGETDRAALLGLRCADGNAGDCTALGNLRLASASGHDRLRGVATLLLGCAQGDSLACGITGATSGPTAWQRVTRSGGGIPEKGSFDKLVRACDAKEPDPGACLDLASAAWSNLGSRDVRDAVGALADDVCAKRSTSAACALAEDLRDPNTVAEPTLDASYRLTAQMCASFGVERACRMSAHLVMLGRTNPWGTTNARDQARLACDEGVDGACDTLTEAYRSPLGKEVLHRCESQRFRGARDDARLCSDAHAVLHFGIGATKNDAEATLARQFACEKGDGNACQQLGNDTWASDKLAAFRWYDLGCTVGHGDACEVSGRMQLYAEHGVTKNVTDAIADLQRGVDAHSHYAAATYGYALYAGEVISRDYNKAWQTNLKGCVWGNVGACRTTGFQLLEGSGVTRNTASAIPLLAWTCARGENGACEALGQAYGGQFGVSVDRGRARWAWSRACSMDRARNVPAAESEACRALNDLSDTNEVTVASSPLPSVRPTSDYRAPATVITDGPSPKPGPGPRPSPGPVDLAGGFGAGFSFGTARSWTAFAQPSVVRGHVWYRARYIGFGIDADWASDNRWRPKVARSYFRGGAWGNVFVPIPFSDRVSLDIGVGGGAGAWRPGPGKVGDLVFSAGAHEYLQLNVHLGAMQLGIRAEQQQLFQKGMALDHVTGLFGMIGGTFD